MLTPTTVANFRDGSATRVRRRCTICSTDSRSAQPADARDDRSNTSATVSTSRADTGPITGLRRPRRRKRRCWRIGRTALGPRAKVWTGAAEVWDSRCPENNSKGRLPSCRRLPCRTIAPRKRPPPVSRSSCTRARAAGGRARETGA